MKEAQIIPLDKFVENALYNENYGYYSKKNPFGKSGDYVTAPNISFLFSEMIAIWIISYWENLQKPKKFNIVELGPGNGDLCKVLIKTFKNFPDFYKNVKIFLYERSKYLQKIQKNKIKEKKVSWLKNINDIKSGPVLFFGNEFFDAIPIKQFKIDKNKIYEKYLSVNKKDKIKIILKKAEKKTIFKLKKFGLFNNKGVIEYPDLGIKELDKMIQVIRKFNGGILLIDYGFLDKKNVSTLQSVKSHKKNEVFENLSDADITSLVNFTLLKDYFLKQNFNLNQVVSQSFFLKRIGILHRAEMLSKKMSFSAKANLYSRLRRLLDSRYMGNLFKVIFAYKNKKKFRLGFN
ncbi:MAG: SAM-dependent methyltransferase [Pelagibacteraceae bacterium]